MWDGHGHTGRVSLRAIWFPSAKPFRLGSIGTGSRHGVVMRLGFLRGVAFVALMVVVVIAVFGGFGVL